MSAPQFIVVTAITRDGTRYGVSQLQDSGFYQEFIPVSLSLERALRIASALNVEEARNEPQLEEIAPDADFDPDPPSLTVLDLVEHPRWRARRRGHYGESATAYWAEESGQVWGQIGPPGERRTVAIAARKVQGLDLVWDERSPE